jgi:hypothetical protein
LRKTERKFDFIFLDGSHLTEVVYQEIQLALKVLEPNGTLLLHDYYPNGSDLFGNGKVILGPYLAVKRLQEEGVGLKVIPFLDLPWETKHDSRDSSLALLTR